VAEAPFIVGIGGSTSPTSITNRLLARCLGAAAESGARTEAIYGAELAELPSFTMSATLEPAGERLLAAVRAADCVIIATPGYHGGMSGLVKNAVDHLELLREDERPYLEGRAVGVIVSAAGWQACGTTLVSVRSTIHALRGWPTPFGVTVNSAEPVEDGAGGFEPRTDGALQILAGQLMDFASWRTPANSSER
jgi:FMN reductase